MKKKEIFVIILAFVLALAFASFIMQGHKSTTTSKEVVTDNEAQVEIEIEDFKQEDSQNEESLNKEEKAKNISQVKTLEKPLVVEKIEVKNEVLKNDLEPDVLQETESNVVVITREFKSDSPAKYSFKGYGVLDKASN